jgi:hypothetical protein
MPPFCIVEEAQSLCDARARVQELDNEETGERVFVRAKDERKN